jgi:hypothetical protein
MYWGPVAPKPRRTGLVVGISIGVAVVLFLGIAGVRAFVATVVSGRNIAGAHGYVTFNGPQGKPLPVGRPWGQACQPVRFTVEEHVPDDVYAQVVSVVNEARADGLDVTLEDRSFNWAPSSLYYPAGKTADDVQRVGIFANTGPAALFSDGQPEHVKLGWDASTDADGKHEDMTDAQGELQLATIGGDPVAERHAVRDIIALTQGVAGSSSSASGLSNGPTAPDNFSAADIAAMKHMSGCNDAAAAVVEHTPVS